LDIAGYRACAARRTEPDSSTTSQARPQRASSTINPKVRSDGVSSGSPARTPAFADRRTIGLFAGLRAEASWSKFGTSSGNVGITPVGRLELCLGRATLVVDAMSYTLAGGTHDALAVHLGRIRQDGPGAKLSRFFSLRLERKVLDVTAQLSYEVKDSASELNRIA
jgi:hypothetical protein